MRKLLLFVWVLTASVAAEPAKQLRLHTDPPDVKVFRIATGGEMSLPVRNSTVEVPDGKFRLVFKAEGYHDSGEQVFEAFQLQPGLNDWPKDRLLILQPVGLQTLSQFYRLHTGLALTLVGLIFVLGLLSLGWGVAVWRRRRLEKQIVQLGGNPEEPLVGPYRRLKPIGAGGFGTVHQAVRQSELFAPKPTLVALKTLNRSLLEAKEGSEQFIKRFAREARALEKLTHPSIVRMFDYDLEAREPYIAMEYVNGQTFEKLLEQHPQGLHPAHALRLIVPVCEALLQAHSLAQPILHRDIKPANLMVDRDQQVKVMDFGLAFTDQESRLTNFDFIGTAHYSPPEAFQSNPLPATDQYAVGLVLYELLTGKRANRSESNEEACMVSISGKLPSLSVQSPHLGDLAKIVDRMSAFDAAARYPSLREVIQELETILRKEGPKSRPSPGQKAAAP